MEELSLDNILGAEEIDNLFLDAPDDEVDNPTTEKKDDTEIKEETTEVDVESLFSEIPESVGSEDTEIEGKEDTVVNKDKESSLSKNNLYSSIAKALQEDGIFPDLDDLDIKNIKAPEDFASVIEKQIQSKLDEKQRRVDEALNLGIEPSEIKKYEDTLNYLDSIDDKTITDETDTGETLRKQLIYQDFINRGYSKERAQREVQKSFNAGTDIEDAKEALLGNKEHFTNQYKSFIETAKQAEAEEIKEREELGKKLKKSILEDDKVFGDLQLDKNIRQRVLDNISKPTYKDPKTGELFTALQKYEMENRTDFLKNVGILFTITEGFKNLDGLVKTKVNKEIKKGLRELEHTLNNTSRNFDGSLQFVSGVSADPESILGKGFDLDI